MAQANEHYRSREGDVSANQSGFTASRMFIVDIDTVGDNPDDVLRDVNTKDKNGDPSAVPQDEPHPTRAGLIASFYQVGERIQVKKYPVTVTYVPPVIFASADQRWEFSFQPGFGSSVVTHDINGVPIGPRTYTTTDEAAQQGPPPPPTHSVTIPGSMDSEGNPVAPKNLGLISSFREDQPAFLTEVQRSVPVGSFSMTAVFPGLNVQKVADLANFGTTVNFIPFMGFRKDTIQFVGPSVFAGQMTLPGGTTGFSWRLTLVFEWNITGLTYRAQDVFVHNGQELPVVRANGIPEIREWLLYQTGSLDAIVSLAIAFGEPLGGVQLPGR